MLKVDGKDPIQAAMEEVSGCGAIDFSRIDWQTLHNELSFDVSISLAADEVGDLNKQEKRNVRRDEIRRLMCDAKRLCQEDQEDDRGIAKHYPLAWPEALSILAELQEAAEVALQPVKDPPEVGNAGERILSKLTENTFLNTVAERMAQRYKKHFGLDAAYSKRRDKKPRCDGPFLRMAQFALREYGEKAYALSSIARALDEVHATTPRPRSKKKRDAYPAPYQN
jgi:hypothetical protein